MPWLLRHELRLLWRRYNFVPKSIGGVAAVLAAAVVAQLVGIGAAALLQDVTALADRLALANAVLLGVGALMLANALDTAVAALFERRDVEWLLASPMPFRRLLAVRMLGVAAAVAAPWLLLLGPVANAMAAFGWPGWLAAYPVLGTLAVLATMAGTALAVCVVAAIGLRRARRLIGILGLAVSGLAFLASQSAALLPPAMRAAVWQALAPGRDGPLGLAWWPARALIGDPAPLLVALPLGLGAPVLAGWILERRFAAGAALDPPRQSAPTPAAALDAGLGTAAGADPRRFRRSTFGALLRKELRLLRRTPNLLSRAAYQLIYVLPAGISLWTGGATADCGLGTLVVFVTGEAARLLVTAAANGDEAAELARTAPVPPSAIRAAKMAAAGLGVAAIFGLPILAAAAWQPRTTPALIAGAACVTMSGLLMGVWRPVPLRRTDLGGVQAGRNGNLLLGRLVNGCWSAATWLAMAGSAWAMLPAALATAVLALIWRSNPAAQTAG